MLLHFFWFEVRYWLRSWMLWIFLAVISLAIFGAVSSPDSITLGVSLENTLRNAPYVIQSYYAVLCLLALLMTTAFVNSSATREFSSNTHLIVFSTPLRRTDYLLGKFLGSALIAVIPMLGISVGILLARLMPWIDPDRWGPVIWSAHLKAILLFAIPSTFFVAAIIFAIASLTRSTMASFTGALLLLIGYIGSIQLTRDLRNETLAAMLDPFGLRAFSLTTKYWTVAEKNHLSLGLTGLLLWNRLLWLAVALVIFAVACARFTFAERSRAGKSDAGEDTAPAVTVMPKLQPSFGAAAQWAQLLSATRLEMKSLIKSVVFLVIALFAFLNSLLGLIFASTSTYGVTSFPVTYAILDIIRHTFDIFLIVIIVYASGALVWEERDARIDEVVDTLPHPDWPAYVSKFLALMASIVILLTVPTITGLLVQFFHGYHRYQIGLLLTSIFGVELSTFLFLAVLAFFIHVISPNKYIGYFVYIAFLIFSSSIWKPLHIDSYMVQFGTAPDMTYSDFFGYAPYLKSWLWFTLYWALFCGLLAIATLLLWPRGRDTAWRLRLPVARLRFKGFLPTATAACTLAFLLVGAWVYYNTKILNTIVTEHAQHAAQADYEKTYKKYEHLNQPRITDVQYAIDLYPESRAMVMHGDETIQNESAQPIDTIHFTTAEDYQTDIDLAGASLTSDDKHLHYRIYKLSPALQPGETRQLRFTVSTHPRGFENSLTNYQIVQNGTFFNNTIAPQIGYQSGVELDDPNDRRKFSLKPKDLMPALERNCTGDCRNTYISNNSDWVNVRTVISTSPDQIAIAPGSLEREWTDNGRRYFSYKLDHTALNFYSFLSARYEVDREDWNGVKLEVYYLKEQPWNVPRMMNSMKKSLGYYIENFGPYPQKEARIIEYPRVTSFAQAFPGTMPYSESIGFIANLDHPDDIDLVFYVVAHEMSHQWWAHQVVGANMQGATVLSETLAQYSAMMVMEKEYGADSMRKFLEYEMDQYLRSRGGEKLKEQPLLTVESSQGYIHYNKGAVATYYLRSMIGEDAFNRALHKIVQQYGYAPPPYPTSYVLTDGLSAETPPQLQYLIHDLFYDITLFSNRTLEATAHKRADGKYDVKITVETHKFKADDKGNETEVPVNDFIEIGALAAPEKEHKYGKVLHRERIHMTSSGKASYEFTTDSLPDKAGIDPLLLLVDRVPEDNLKSVTVVP